MCLKLWFLLLTITVSVKCTNNDTCNYIQEHCEAFIQHGTVTYPNYADFKTPDLIRHFGYPVEVHNTITADGYILTTHRIPFSNVSKSRTGKIPVYLLHGILASSAQWFWQPAERALVFMLADAGYDVWIGNARGTSYSQGHISLPSNNPSNLTYWNFSTYEMGKYDIPAIVNYITNITSQPSLYYIGHSLGTTQFFISLTLNPSLKTKIRTFFAIAPVGYTGNSTNTMFQAVAPLYSQYSFQLVANIMGNGMFLPEVLQDNIPNLTDYCSNSALDCSLCSNVFFFLFGIDPCQTNFTTLPGLLAHLPDIVSSKTFSHQMQEFRYGSFSQYDYGPLLNLKKYGKLTPPDYNWSNFDVPVVMYHSDNDNLAVPKDVFKTVNALNSNVVKEINRIPLSYWTHMDFIIGIDADIYVYKPIIKIMNNRTYG